MCRVMGLPGKPDGMNGNEVEKYYREGRIREIADYCETDVVNTYRVWLRYELFRGRLSKRLSPSGHGATPRWIVLTRNPRTNRRFQSASFMESVV
jgi:hypothetical protein